jgi:hypothetical protein
MRHDETSRVVKIFVTGSIPPVIADNCAVKCPRPLQLGTLHILGRIQTGAVAKSQHQDILRVEMTRISRKPPSMSVASG